MKSSSSSSSSSNAILLLFLVSCFITDCSNANLSSNLVSVTSCHLVDTTTSQDLLELTDGTTYSIEDVGESLTIRCDVNVETTATMMEDTWVSFDLNDGLMTRTEETAPFVLAGKNSISGKFFKTSTLTQPGKLRLNVCPVSLGMPANLAPALEEEQRPFDPVVELSVVNNNNNDAPVDDANTVVVESDTTSGVVDSDDCTDSGGGLLGGLLGLLSGSRSSCNGSRRRLHHKNDEAGIFNRLFVGFTRSGSDSRHLQDDDSTENGCLAMTLFVTEKAGSVDLPPTPAPAPVTDVLPYPTHPKGAVSGDFTQWSTVTIGFQGPEASEWGTSLREFFGDRKSSVFSEYVADVTFTHIATQQSFVVPAYFALDGNAANNGVGSSSGNVWLCHFVPPMEGPYEWFASFKTGGSVASTGGIDSAEYFDGMTGKFTIAPAVTEMKGSLQYVGKHHLQFASNNEFLFNMGLDSPENVLAFEDFDNASNNNGYLKTFTDHVIDYLPGNPTWQGGKGIGLLGAVNYLASQGVNILSVTTLTAGGADGNITPFDNDEAAVERIAFDVSKLEQWQIVLSHACSLGMAVRIKLQDSGSDDILEGIGSGASSSSFVSEQRKIYYREMIARFGHLNVIWDLGEEMTDVDQIKARAEFIKSLDPYKSPVIVNVLEEVQEVVFSELLGFEFIDGVSVASTALGNIGNLIEEWVGKSADAGHPWVISSDEQGDLFSGLEDVGLDTVRTQVLWPSIMGGGAGIQYYMGATQNLELQNFREVEGLLQQSAAAQTILTQIPLWDMSPVPGTSSLLGLLPTGVQVMMDAEENNLMIYMLPSLLSTVLGILNPSLVLNLPGGLQRTYQVQWFSPRSGEVAGEVAIVNAGLNINLGTPPNDSDWVIILKCQSGCSSSN